MIDIENTVLTAIRTEVRSNIPDCVVTSVYSQTPKKFPCVSVIMTDNYVNQSTMDSSGIENHARVTFTIEVFTGFTEQNKTSAKTIFHMVDSVMEGLGFVRTMYAQLPNMDKTVFRLTGRYRAIVSQPESTIGSDTYTYRTYREE